MYYVLITIHAYFANLFAYYWVRLRRRRYSLQWRRYIRGVRWGTCTAYSNMYFIPGLSRLFKAIH